MPHILSMNLNLMTNSDLERREGKIEYSEAIPPIQLTIFASVARES
jgi:hypothetical protein